MRIFPLMGAALLAGVLGCSELLFGVRSLEVSPNPAQPGDAVSFAFWLSVVPEQDYTLTAFIDSTAELTEEGFAAVDGPYVMAVGTADDLIASYGLGTHTAHIEVRLTDRDKTARTLPVTFELQAAQPVPPNRP